MNFEKHIFICTSCTQKNGQPTQSVADFRKKVKNLANERFPNASIRVNSSGCLGHCERGISCVIYPEGKWLLELTDQDASKILSEISDTSNS